MRQWPGGETNLVFLEEIFLLQSFYQIAVSFLSPIYALKWGSVKLKELMALVCTEVTLTQYGKGGVVSQELIFYMQQGHVPVRIHDPLVCAK